MGTKQQYAVAVVNTTNEDTQVTVGASATSSSILVCGGAQPTGLFLPLTFVSCNISFQVAKTINSGFFTMTNFDGSAFSVAGVAGNFVPLVPAMFNSVIVLQLLFSAAQTTAETIDVALSPIFQGIHN